MRMDNQLLLNYPENLIIKYLVLLLYNIITVSLSTQKSLLQQYQVLDSTQLYYL